MLDVCNPLPELLDEDGMWEDDLHEKYNPSWEKPRHATLAWRCTIWACTKIAKVVPRSHWDGKSTWWIDRILAEKARQWEEGDHQACEEECRKMGWHWVDMVCD